MSRFCVLWQLVFTASFGLMLSPKGETLGTVLFLITSQIEWYKLCSLSTYCMEVTALCLQSRITAKISVYAFSVHFY